MGLLRDAVLAGVGLLALTREKAQQVVDGWVREGRFSREEAGRLLAELAERGELERRIEGLEHRVERVESLAAQANAGEGRGAD